jgi:hypothetical protein
VRLIAIPETNVMNLAEINENINVVIGTRGFGARALCANMIAVTRKIEEMVIVATSVNDQGADHRAITSDKMIEE